MLVVIWFYRQHLNISFQHCRYHRKSFIFFVKGITPSPHPWIFYVFCISWLTRFFFLWIWCILIISMTLIVICLLSGKCSLIPPVLPICNDHCCFKDFNYSYFPRLSSWKPAQTSVCHYSIMSVFKINFYC